MTKNKVIIYYINKDHLNDPFDTNPNDTLVGRITYRGVDIYLYLDDAGQQYFVRYLKKGYLKEEGFGTYCAVALSDIVQMIDYDMFDINEDISMYWDSEYEVRGDEWTYDF